MAILDKLKSLLRGHEEQAKQGVDAVAELADEKTGGKHSAQIDAVKEKINEQLGGEDQPPEQGTEPAPG